MLPECFLNIHPPLPGVKAPEMRPLDGKAHVVHLQNYVPKKTSRLWPGWASARMHGILMVTGFIFLTPAGVLCSRYLKHKEKTWFKLHTRIMYTAVAAVLVAVSLALYDMWPINAPYMHGQVCDTRKGLFINIILRMQYYTACYMLGHGIPTGLLDV
jgi:hypothetical protein